MENNDNTIKMISEMKKHIENLKINDDIDVINNDLIEKSKTTENLTQIYFENYLEKLDEKIELFKISLNDYDRNIHEHEQNKINYEVNIKHLEKFKNDYNKIIDKLGEMENLTPYDNLRDTYRKNMKSLETTKAFLNHTNQSLESLKKEKEIKQQEYNDLVRVREEYKQTVEKINNIA